MSTGGWTEVMQILKRSEKLLQDTLLCDEKSVADALVAELKYNKSANSAMQQIKNRQYTRALQDYSGEILLVGINYDKHNVSKPHSCVIEKLTCHTGDIPE